MRITAVRTTPLLLPYRQPYHWAYGVMDGAEPVLVEIETDAGITGYGESIGATDAAAVLAALRRVTPDLIGHEAFAIARLTEPERARLALAQQCRPDDLERVASAYAALGFGAELAAFFDDLPRRMTESHLVVSRAGASTVAELLALGRPALLVPFRFAAEDHQRANAEAVSRAAAAWLIEETRFDAEALADKLRICLEEPQQLSALARSAAELGRTDAAGALADEVQSLVAPAAVNTQMEALA